MRIFLGFVFVLLSSSSTYAAGESDCLLIRDETSRRMCLSRATGNESECGLIRDWDDERYCRATARSHRAR